MNRIEMIKLLKEVKEDEIKNRKVDITQPYIFISYESDDSKIVWPIFKELYDKGYNLFIDRSNFVIGEKHTYQAFKAIKDKNCKDFILFISEKSLLNDNVLRELGYWSKKIKGIQMFNDSNINSIRGFIDKIIDEDLSKAFEIEEKFEKIGGIDHQLFIRIEDASSKDDFINRIAKETLHELEITKMEEVNNNADLFGDDKINVKLNIIDASSRDNNEEDDVIKKLNNGLNKALNSEVSLFLDKIKEVYNYTEFFGKAFKEENKLEELCKNDLKVLLKKYINYINIGGEYDHSKICYGKGYYRGNGPYIYVANKNVSPSPTKGYHIAIFIDKSKKIQFTFQLGLDSIKNSIERWYLKNDKIKNKYKKENDFKIDIINGEYSELRKELIDEFAEIGYKEGGKWLPKPKASDENGNIFIKEIAIDDIKDTRSFFEELNKLLVKYIRFANEHKYDLDYIDDNADNNDE